MAYQNNTILITGGTSGLGLEMAQRFVGHGNTVIVCSRTEERIKETKKKWPEVITYRCDISVKEDRERLSQWIRTDHPKLNVLINNAAIVHKIDFIKDEKSLDKLDYEVATNLTAPIHLIKLLFPILIRNPNSKIINITTGLVYVPRSAYPFYNATKAALHSFTKVLRYQLRNEPIKIIEVLFPAVNTPWHQGHPPKIAITTEKAIDEMMKGLLDNKEEIKVAGVKLLYLLSRLAPAWAFRKINSLK